MESRSASRVPPPDEVTWIAYARRQFAEVMSTDEYRPALLIELASWLNDRKWWSRHPDQRLDAEELARRVDRALGQMIRAAQDKGMVAKSGQVKATGKLPVPEYVRLGAHTGWFYTLAALTDRQFEDTLTRARAAGNLSRPNVIRCITDDVPTELTTPQRVARIRELATGPSTAEQIAQEVGVAPQRVRFLARRNNITITADQVLGNRRKVDSNRIMQETVTMLDGLASGLRLIDYHDLDDAHRAGWAASLTQSLRTFNQLTRKIKENS